MKIKMDLENNNVTDSKVGRKRKRDRVKNIVRDSARIIAEEKLLFIIYVVIVLFLFGDKIK